MDFMRLLNLEYLDLSFIDLKEEEWWEQDISKF